MILPETLASAICITDGTAVIASWGEDSDRCPTGTPVVLESTLRVIENERMEVFARETSGPDEPHFFPRLQAGITAPLIVRDRCMGTFELYYPRYSDIDARQTALATGFAELISTQLASFELERQEDLSARMELRALQSQVDPHFLFNTIGTIVSLVRTEPEKARSLLIDFSNYYRQTLSNSDALTSLENELDQGMRYINLMQARYGDGRLKLSVDFDPFTLDCRVPPFILQPLLENINLMQARYGDGRLKLSVDFDPFTLDCRVPPFILQPLLENCIKHAMREVEPLSIKLSSLETDDGIQIVVEDDGIGMNEETLAHLLDVKRDEGDTCPCGCAEEDGECVEAKLESMSRRDAPTTADGSLKRGGGLALVNVLMRIHFFFGAESGIHVESQEGSMSRRDAPTTADGSLKRGGGLALVNVLMRIHFFFGAESGIHVESQEGVGTRVTVDLIGEPHEPEGTMLPSAR